jgi:hypothetical protein
MHIWWDFSLFRKPPASQAPFCKELAAPISPLMPPAQGKKDQELMH